MTRDPGYGDPNAPVGTPEWAKRWRLCFQSAVKQLPSAPAANLAFYEAGKEHRAWTLVTDEAGRPYPDFDAFCRDRQPWGLGTDPVKFRAHLAAELGERAADLVTVAPGTDKGGRPRKGEETGTAAVPVSDEMSPMKEKRLRAILRAPEVIQDLYRDGKITQADAARLGPKSPGPEQAARVAEARQEIERLDTRDPAFRKKAGAVVRRVLGGRPATLTVPAGDVRAAATALARHFGPDDLARLVALLLEATGGEVAELSCSNAE